MRKELRYQSNLDYWDHRWASEQDDEDRFSDLTIYPIKYVEMVMSGSEGLAAELGCGLGRVLKHYHNEGKNIIGIERSKIAVERIKKRDQAYRVIIGDVRTLAFKNELFDTVLAFGLYHNLEEGSLDSLRETVRCMKTGGRFCISMRPDNLEMRINEYYWLFKQWNIKTKKEKYFHKWLVKEREFRSILEKTGLKVEKVYYARNVSFLWRLPFLRIGKPGGKKMNGYRSEGYRLNWVGKVIDGLLVTLFPASFCNVLVFIGSKI